MSPLSVHYVAKSANRLCWACRRLTGASTQARFFLVAVFKQGVDRQTTPTVQF